MRPYLLLPILLPILLAGCLQTEFPGESHSGPLPPLSAAQASLAHTLEADVRVLAEKAGERNHTLQHGSALILARKHIAASFKAAGYAVEEQAYDFQEPIFHPYGDTVQPMNLVAELKGASKPAEIVIIGAHYDSAPGTPGANDNGSGVASLLALARALKGGSPARTLRFVAYDNEEPPFFRGPSMGSAVHAKRCKAQGERVVAMLSLETMGSYSKQPQSQNYPFPLNWFYPSTGDFIAFVGDPSSKDLVRRVIKNFRQHAAFPSEGAIAPRSITGIDWSDHRSYWAEGYPALMVTDTAFNRHADYHQPDDTPEKIDYQSLARVTEGLRAVIQDLCDGP